MEKFEKKIKKCASSHTNCSGRSVVLKIMDSFSKTGFAEFDFSSSPTQLHERKHHEKKNQNAGAELYLLGSSSTFIAILEAGVIDPVNRNGIIVARKQVRVSIILSRH